MSDPTESGRDAVTKPTRSRHDWPTLLAEWAPGTESIREFAARKGIRADVVLRQAARDNWKAAREAARAKVADGVGRKAVAHRIRTEAEIDGAAHRAATRFARRVERMLFGEDGRPVRFILDDAPKVKAAADALEKLHRLARITAHLPAEPVANVAEQRIAVVVRGMDEHGEVVEDGDDSEDAGRRPDGLPADEDAGEVPSQ